MANPWAGEVALTIGGERHVAKLTLGALAELEDALGSGGLVPLIERFDAGGYGTRDVVALLLAGLRACGWRGTAADLMTAEIEGGPLEGARAAAALLARAFRAP